MSFEEEFDKIIRQKVQQHHVPFDQSNWEKAQHMIDGQRTPVTSGKALSFTKLLGLAGIATVVTASIYFYSKSQATHRNVAQLENKNFKKDVKQQIESTASAEKKLIEENQNNTQAIIQSNKPLTETSTKSKTVSHYISYNNNNEHLNNILASITPAQSKTQVFDKAETIANNEIITNQNVEARVEDAIEMLANNSNQSVESENIEKQATAITNNKGVNLPQNNNVAQTITGNEMPNTEISLPKNVAETLTKMPFSRPSFDFLSPATINHETIIDTVLKTMSIEKISIKDGPIVFNAKTKSRFFNVGFGTNYCNGWNANNGRDGQGLNYFIHINYGFYLSKRLSLGAGLDFYNLQNIKQAFYTTEKTEYGFSSSNTYTSVTSNNLKYIGIPLKLYFDLNTSNILSFGILPSFLVGAQNTINVYKKLDGQNISSQQVKNNVLYDGIAQKNIQMSVGYKFRLTARIWIQSDLMMGISDLFINNAAENHIQKPLGLRLGLQYHIFDK